VYISLLVDHHFAEQYRMFVCCLYYGTLKKGPQRGDGEITESDYWSYPRNWQ